MLLKPACFFMVTLTVLITVSPISSTKLLLAKKIAVGAHAVGAHVAVKTALHAKSTAIKAAVKAPIIKLNGLVKAKVAPAFGLLKTSKLGKFGKLHALALGKIGLVKAPKIAKLTKLGLPIIAPLAALKLKPAVGLLGAASLAKGPILGHLGIPKPPVAVVAPLGPLKLSPSLGLIQADHPAAGVLPAAASGIAGTLQHLLTNNPIAGVIRSVLPQPEIAETTYSFVPNLGVSNYNAVRYTPLDTDAHSVAYGGGVIQPPSTY